MKYNDLKKANQATSKAYSALRLTPNLQKIYRQNPKPSLLNSKGGSKYSRFDVDELQQLIEKSND